MIVRFELSPPGRTTLRINELASHIHHLNRLSNSDNLFAAFPRQPRIIQLLFQYVNRLVIPNQNTELSHPNRRVRYT